MIAIVSHDIDHLSVREHLFTDLIIPKFIVRSKIELIKGHISFTEYSNRMKDLIKNKWQNLDELVSFNKANGLQSSFFLAVNKGLGLSYTNHDALIWYNFLKNKGANVYLHGISYNNLEGMNSEYDLFKTLFKQAPLGIRMHYIRHNEYTYKYMSKIGYKFDSTLHEYKNPYKINDMWIFPIQIMDGWIIQSNNKWQSHDLTKSKEATKRIIDHCFKCNLRYLGIDFHDRYFSKSFKTWMEWYIWLIDYLKSNGIKLSNFEVEISCLNNIQY